MERIDPPKAADEKTTLLAYLDYQRATMLRKVDGLADEAARWSPVPTGTSLYGLLAHLTMVERWWFTAVVGDADDVTFPWSDDDPDADWRGPAGATLADVVAAYEAECATSNAVLASADLDTVTSRRYAKHGWNVRAVVVHMIEETARHAGHADLLRELLDGAVGE
jgi:uncharacterized damage-inducible protein DinB